jgi:hypothetical protein
LGMSAPMKSRRAYVVDAVRSWGSFMEIVERYSLKQDLFSWRGQSDSSWRLESKLSRDRPEMVQNPGWTSLHLSGFKHAALGRQFDLAPEESENRWWAVGRHAGLATPLLDWSMSPYVAAFFAFWNEGRKPTSKMCSVFCLNWRVLDSVGASRKAAEPNDYKALSDCLVLVHPHAHDNPPMTRQSGVFTRLYPPRTDLIAWVSEVWGSRVDRLLVRYDMPLSQRDVALRSLRRMNVHPASLFPDLRGSAEFCNLGLVVPRYAPGLDRAVDSEALFYGPPAPI